MAERLVELSVEAFLDTVAAGSTRLGSSSLAAATVAGAAGLVAMAARRTQRWVGAGGAAGQADVHRARALRLVSESAEAFDRAVAELEGEPAPGEGAEQRDWQLGQALIRAADAPIAVAEVAADTALLAAEVARGCAEAARADAFAAGVMAEGAAAAAAHLVLVNLAAAGDDERLSTARLLSEAAAQSRDQITQGAA